MVMCAMSSPGASPQRPGVIITHPNRDKPVVQGTRATVVLLLLASAGLLLINTIGSWYKRPQASTAIPNLFLASDYVQTNIDLATMEGANESARAAVTALMEAAGSKASPPRMYRLFEPPEFEPAKREDAERFKRGEPHVLDGPWPGD